MTVYARRDINWVGISADHGGCGKDHYRPEGAELWALKCPECENHLRHDPLWASTIAEIPETPDEATSREDWEKRGAYDEKKLMAMAMARITGLEVPESLLRALPARFQALPAAGTVECGNGHGVAAGSKFCPECGEPLRGVVPASVAPQPGGFAGSSGRLTVSAEEARRRPLAQWRIDDLKELARTRGLPDEGTRVEVLERIRAAG